MSRVFAPKDRKNHLNLILNLPALFLACTVFEPCKEKRMNPNLTQSVLRKFWIPAFAGTTLLLANPSPADAAGVCVPDLAPKVNSLSELLDAMLQSAIEVNNEIYEMDRRIYHTRTELSCMMVSPVEWGCGASRTSEPTAPAAQDGPFCWCRLGWKGSCPASSWKTNSPNLGSTETCASDCEARCYNNPMWRRDTTWSFDF